MVLLVLILVLALPLLRSLDMGPHKCHTHIEVSSSLVQLVLVVRFLAVNESPL